MKSMIALGVGLVVALAPGTAFADAEPNGTGSGKAYGNCRHSSATGVNDPRLPGGAGKGNGGHAKQVKAALDAGVELDAMCAVILPAPPVVGDGNDESGAPAS